MTPDELADRLLTRILGFDNLLYAARDKPISKKDARTLLQKVNPGWTATFAPDAMISWMSSLDLIDPTASSELRLTERGKRWADKISWVPKGLTAGAGQAPPPGKISLPEYEVLSKRFSSLLGADVHFDDSYLQQLHAGLWSHPIRHFAVLAGLSGSGKTLLALQYARALVDAKDYEENDQIEVVPVQPGWYDSTELLGYLNPINGQVDAPKFRELLNRAAADPVNPYVVILDEMNLSHPEQYFAPLLSAMETGGAIAMPTGGESEADVDALKYPSNLAVIGTINMDETTYGLSDKVLDRAYWLEFWKVKVSDFPRWGKTGLEPAFEESVRDLLTQLSDALAGVRLHFGWRVINDVVSYLAFTKDLGGTGNVHLDTVVYSKVLPKLRGDDTPRFRAALDGCKGVLGKFGMTRSVAKVSEMIVDLSEYQTARFSR